QSEARIYARYILQNHPNAKIGILFQNDDLGRDYVTGLKEGLGAKAASMIIGEASYELTDPTVDSQIVKLKSLGADLLYNASTPRFAAQAIKKVADMGWKPVHILDINASPVSATLKPAGLDISKGIISTNYGKDPSDPQWKDDAGVKAYFTFMDKYYPEGDKMNTVNTYGYSVAELLIHILKQAGDDLSRENIMKQATSIKNFTGSLALPGMVVNTSPTDYRINKQMQMMKFDGERWQLFGPIITDDAAG
ncbi:MAG: branched-chain amino acid transporter substrate-binding protein, partial [Tardiphaga sp.]|nr:branched-chain amino acid transporter substrate-binding protein [Tardiphaga sp.]